MDSHSSRGYRNPASIRGLRRYGALDAGDRAGEAGAMLARHERFRTDAALAGLRVAPPRLGVVAPHRTVWRRIVAGAALQWRSMAAGGRGVAGLAKR
jgi:hypothetical protein